MKVTRVIGVIALNHIPRVTFAVYRIQQIKILREWKVWVASFAIVLMDLLIIYDFLFLINLKLVE